MENFSTEEKSTGNELEKLKQEIFAEVRFNKLRKKTKKHLFWGSLAVTTVLVVLTVLSITQAVQSAAILNKINSGEIKAAVSGGSSASSLPSTLDNLPNMVGGC